MALVSLPANRNTSTSPRPLEDHSATLRHPIIKEFIDQLIRAYTWEGHPYIAEDYGHIVLNEPQDTECVLDEIWDGWTLLDIPWEGIMLRDGFFIAIFLARRSFLLMVTTVPQLLSRPPTPKDGPYAKWHGR